MGKFSSLDTERRKLFGAKMPAESVDLGYNELLKTFVCRLLDDRQKVKGEMLKHLGVIAVFAFSALDTALEASLKIKGLAREMVKTWRETAQTYAQQQKPSQAKK